MRIVGDHRLSPEAPSLAVGEFPAQDPDPAGRGNPELHRRGPRPDGIAKSGLRILDPEADARHEPQDARKSPPPVGRRRLSQVTEEAEPFANDQEITEQRQGTGHREDDPDGDTQGLENIDEDVSHWKVL